MAFQNLCPPALIYLRDFMDNASRGFQKRKAEEEKKNKNI